MRKDKLYTGVLSLAIIFSSCFLVNPKSNDKNNTASANANDSTEIFNMSFKHKPNVVEYEVSVLKGTKTKHGIKKRFYEHGSVYSETPYIKGKRNGISYTFYQAYDDKKPVVWKEQPFIDGVLSGTCRRFHRNGQLQSEYQYSNGLPAIGIKVWKDSGKEVELPKLIVTKKETNGLIFINVRISNNTKKVKYFTGNLIKGKYFPKNMKSILENDGVGELLVHGNSNQKSVTIVAALKTPYRNTYYLVKTVEL